MKYIKIIVWGLISLAVVFFWIGLRKDEQGMLETLIALGLCLGALSLEQYIKHKQKKD
ncbi:MAG: hypothetical protein MI784_17155 [Cytophagales bacterium]|nr:hypothetical protein [Cytophagales bacterium]